MELDLQQFFKDLILEHSEPFFNGKSVMIQINAENFEVLTEKLEEHAKDFRNMP